MISKSGGPRAGCAVRKWVWCACQRHAGWRSVRAGPSFAGWCPHPTGSCLRFSLPGHGRLETASGFIRHVPDLALATRGRQGVNKDVKRPPPLRKAARHRPVSTLTLTAGRRGPAQRARISPVAGLARSSPKGVTTLPAEPAGAPPPPSSRRTLRQTPGGLPPAWTGTFPAPSGDGSAHSMTRGLEGVEEMG